MCLTILLSLNTFNALLQQVTKLSMNRQNFNNRSKNILHERIGDHGILLEEISQRNRHAMQQNTSHT